MHWITVLRREGISHEVVGAYAGTVRKLLGGDTGGGGWYRASAVQCYYNIILSIDSSETVVEAAGIAFQDIIVHEVTQSGHAQSGSTKFRPSNKQLLC